MAQTLVELVRAKYPGAYDDLDDLSLDALVREKHPGVYDDLPKPEPNFRTEAVGSRGLLSPSTLEDFPVLNAAKGAWNVVKEIPAGLWQTVTDPIGTVKQVGEAQGALGLQAKEAFDRGEYFRATIKGVEYLIPILGPMMAAAGDKMEQGDVAEGIGELGMGTLLTLGGAKTQPKLRGQVRGRPALNPAEAEAVAFAQQEGIPLDAGTATGSQWVKNAQKKAGGSWGGANTVETAQRAQADALAVTGEKLVARANEGPDGAPGKPVMAVEAGEGIQSAMKGKLSAEDKRADTAYGRLRDYEAGAAPEDVAVRSQSVASDPKALDRNFILRWLADDLKEMPYQSSGRMRGQQAIDTMTEATSQEAGRRALYTPRVAGSPVQDTLNLAGVSGTKAELAARIERGLQTGKIDSKLAKIADAYAEAWDGQQFDFDIVSDQALADAGIRRRSMKSPITMPDVTEPGASRFFADQALPEVPKALATESQRFSIDLRPFKPQLQPAMDRLNAKLEYGPLMGAEQNAAVRLKALLNGPDFAPLSVVDAVLGDLKSLARADMPELRTSGQGIMADTVRRLDAIVRARAAKAGPQVLAALNEGRAATVSKYATKDAMKLIAPLKGKGSEPQAVFARLTAKKDAGLAKLRELQKQAPEEVPNVARALLEEIFDKPTSEGGFQFAAKAQADWQKLGAGTKKILFPKEGHVRALDNFFLLAKKIGENPNPSGTAQTLNATNVVAGIPMYALAKLLYTPNGVRALTRAMEISVSPKPAAQAAAMAQLARAGKEAGVILPFPKAAEQSEPMPGRRPQ